jgi:hypothetical protein
MDDHWKFCKKVNDKEVSIVLFNWYYLENKSPNKNP